MSQITPQLIKELRERTGIGMSKCKAALQESGGDIDKAIENLRKAGMASAVKKEGREANEGLIGIGESPSAIALVEINSETDFVAQNEKFKQFVKDVAHQAAEMEPASLEVFLKEPAQHDSSITVDQYRALIVQSLGENIQIKRLALFKKSPSQSIGIYSHMGGKIVTAIELAGGEGHEDVARDIAMHIAAEAPDYLTSEDVPEEIKEREKDIAREQVKGKPEKIVEKILAGKLKAFFDQYCLMRQKYVKDSTMTISELLEKESKSRGVTFALQKFLRWQVGA